jgi:HAD superfamily hydrolase (TIGR01459 family)
MGCRIIQGLSEVSGDYEALLCDLWGCYHNGLTPYPAAVEACRAFRASGGLVVLLTNAPRPAASVRRFLDNIGAPSDSYDEIVSSGGACQAALESGRFGRDVQYVGPERDLHMLTDIGLAPADAAEAEAVLVTGLRDDRTETPADYAGEIADWAARDLPLLCANPDIVVDRGDERLWCAGAIARDYEAAGGRVVWYGKPHRPIYERCFEVMEQLSGRPVPRERVLAAGDGVATDVEGGIRAGLNVLFVTGGLAAGEFGPDPEHPEPARLEAFLSENEVGPRYAIGRLR